MKATYTAAQAQTRIGEAVAGISGSMSDAGATMQRAEDKISQMQARAGAIDELLASGALTDLSSSTDDIQAKLNKVSATAQVDRELAAAQDRVGRRPRRRAAPGGRARRRRRSRGAGHDHPVPPRRPRDTTRGEFLMAINRRIPADHGLTVRMFITGLLMVLLYALVIGILFAVGLNLGVILVIAAAFLFCQYWFSDKIALFGMHGRIVTAEQEPELHGIIDRLCALADMPKPRVPRRRSGHAQRLRHGPEPEERRGVRHPGHHAPARRARRLRSGPGARDLPTWRTATWPS